jgi:NADPH:quinone reductase-like Zn-dependent oxidoreductase
MIRRGRYPDFKGPLPFTPGYEIVGVIEKTGARWTTGSRQRKKFTISSLDLCLTNQNRVDVRARQLFVTTSYRWLTSDLGGASGLKAQAGEPPEGVYHHVTASGNARSSTVQATKMEL